MTGGWEDTLFGASSLLKGAPKLPCSGPAARRLGEEKERREKRKKERRREGEKKRRRGKGIETGRKSGG